MKLLSALAATLLSTLVACGPEYDRTEITAVTTSKLGGDISTSRFLVPEGLPVKAHIVAWNDDKDPLSLVVRARDPEIVDVRSAVNANDYVFIGNKLGETEIEFVADGTLVLTIPARVTVQPYSE